MDLTAWHRCDCLVLMVCPGMDRTAREGLRDMDGTFRHGWDDLARMGCLTCSDGLTH
jgi:hypothetical protein